MNDDYHNATPSSEPKPAQLSQNGILDDNVACPNTMGVKLSRYDVAALTAKRLNPNATPHAIGKILVKSGLSSDKNTIYSRLKRSDYLQGEFVQLEKSLREQLVREEYPLARKAIRKILKDKDNTVPPNAQVAAAKLIYDKVHADKNEQPGSPVNIENIERLQVLIQSDVGLITGDSQ